MVIINLAVQRIQSCLPSLLLYSRTFRVAALFDTFPIHLIELLLRAKVPAMHDMYSNLRAKVPVMHDMYSRYL